MRLHRTAIAFLAWVALGSSAMLNAQVTMTGATAKCVDGTYSRARTKQGACSGHDGIARWFGPGGATATAAPAKHARSVEAEPIRVPSAVPAGATARCEDGTYSQAKNRSGACSTHGGVAKWIAGGSDVSPERERDVTPAGDARGATALCSDGTYSQSQHRSGTCSYHKGVKRWLKQIPN